MKRGYVKQWRKEQDSPIWRKPPLYLKAWQWLKMNVDHNTGSIKTSMNLIADGLEYEERGVTRKPNRKTVRDILAFFEGNGSIAFESNRQYTTITLINWSIYQGKAATKVTQNGQPEVTEDGLPSGLPSGHMTRSTPEEVQESESKALKPCAYGASPHQVVMDYLWQCCEEIGFNGKSKKALGSYLAGLIKMYGYEIPPDLFRKFAASKKKVADIKRKYPDITAEAYFAGACQKELEKRRQDSAKEEPQLPYYRKIEVPQE